VLLHDFLKSRSNQHWIHDQLIAVNTASSPIYAYEEIENPLRSLSPALRSGLQKASRHCSIAPFGMVWSRI
jgi:hypothetical protein